MSLYDRIAVLLHRRKMEREDKEQHVHMWKLALGSRTHNLPDRQGRFWALGFKTATQPPLNPPLNPLTQPLLNPPLFYDFFGAGVGRVWHRGWSQRRRSSRQTTSGPKRWAASWASWRFVTWALAPFSATLSLSYCAAASVILLSSVRRSSVSATGADTVAASLLLFADLCATACANFRFAAEAASANHGRTFLA